MVIKGEEEQCGSRKHPVSTIPQIVRIKKKAFHYHVTILS